MSIVSSLSESIERIEAIVKNKPADTTEESSIENVVITIMQGEEEAQDVSTKESSDRVFLITQGEEETDNVLAIRTVETEVDAAPGTGTDETQVDYALTTINVEENNIEGESKSEALVVRAQEQADTEAQEDSQQLVAKSSTNEVIFEDIKQSALDVAKKDITQEVIKKAAKKEGIKYLVSAFGLYLEVTVS